MSEEKKQTKAVESKTNDESLADESLDQASGGVDAGDLADWRSNYGVGPSAAGKEPNRAPDQLKDGDATSSDPEWKYVPVRRTT